MSLLALLVPTTARAAPSEPSRLHAPLSRYADRDDVRAFIADMQVRHGFDADALRELFGQARMMPAAIKAILPPADPGVRSWQAYRKRFIEPRRLTAGRRFMQEHAATLRAAEERFGIPAPIIASIIGIETIYGRHMGDFETFSTLTTLAFDYPPRAALFRTELEALLLLAREEGRRPTAYVGSFAGALGLPQFLPSSVRKYAIDFDGDGRIDLNSSPADAIGSVARFLSEHGWVREGPIAISVEAGGDGLQALIEEGILPKRTPEDMQSRGVALVARVGDDGHGRNTGNNGQTDNTPALPNQPAALIDLVTPNAPTEYRLGYRNFYVITRYNRSSFYASTVMDFAAVLAGKQGLF